MRDELTRRCTRDDELFQGAYLVDKAQEMAWQCGQYGGRDKNDQYNTFDRRDQYDRQDSYGNGAMPHLEDEGELAQLTVTNNVQFN